MKGVIELFPLLIRDEPAEQCVVERTYRPGDVVSIVVLVDRSPAVTTSRDIRRLDDDGEVIEQCAVPIPDDVLHPRQITDRFKNESTGPRLGCATFEEDDHDDGKCQI